MIKNLSVAILQLSEAGELAYLQGKWWASSCIADKAKSSAAPPHSLKGMFLVLSLGLGLGALLAILELTSKSRRSSGEQRVRSSALVNHTTNTNASKRSNAEDTTLQLLFHTQAKRVSGCFEAHVCSKLLFDKNVSKPKQIDHYQWKSCNESKGPLLTFVSTYRLNLNLFHTCFINTGISWHRTPIFTKAFESPPRFSHKILAQGIRQNSECQNLYGVYLGTLSLFDLN